MIWPEVESAFDEVCRRIGVKDPKENRGLRVMLRRMQGHLIAYGPLFSDALRSLDRSSSCCLMLRRECVSSFGAPIPAL